LVQNSFFLKEPFVDILDEPKKNSNISSQKKNKYNRQTREEEE